MKIIGLYSFLTVLSSSWAFLLSKNNHPRLLSSTVAVGAKDEDRRSFLSSVVATTGAIIAGTASSTLSQPAAEAVGPVKIALDPKSYKAAPCPPSKPIPGEKAMFGMRGLCVTVEADLLESSPKDLEKVGVYGFVVDGDTGNSVLANNPDLR
jgi:hypothetical protein